MLFWKIFAVTDVLISLGYWRAIFRRTYQLERSDWLYIPVSLVGTVGVIAYAFTMPTLAEPFWRIMLPIYLASVAWEISSIVRQPDANAGTYIGILLVVLLAGFTSVALFRLGGSNWIEVLGG